ncbi:hypothetical protein, partial [Planktothrix sp.]|uniref:hypothetical protein n=1 Tax=Planktothrix sp. TaxID=3088171 RepID=UPI0038D4DA5C
MPDLYDEDSLESSGYLGWPEGWNSYSDLVLQPGDTDTFTFEVASTGYVDVFLDSDETSGDL